MRHVPVGRRYLLAAAVLVPLAVCLILVPFRRHVPNTSAALILVLVVVAFAASGDRLAGVLAACSAGLGFDLLLTRPYQRLTIASAVDIQTDLLLIAVGLAVTQIAHWGYRQQAAASRRAGYLDGIQEAAQVVATGAAAPSTFVGTVAERLTTLLGLSRCHFDYGTGRDHPRLDADGSVRWRREVCDVDRLGLPTGDPRRRGRRGRPLALTGHPGVPCDTPGGILAASAREGPRRELFDDRAPGDTVRTYRGAGP